LLLRTEYRQGIFPVVIPPLLRGHVVTETD